MKSKALFPGSFDPFHLGHLDIVNRGLQVFEEIVIGIGTNSQKKYQFSLQEREDKLKEIFKNEPRVTVQTFTGLTVDFCKKLNSQFILRGLRNASDFEFEKNIAQMNKSMYNDLDTVLLITDPALSSIQSTIIRDIIRNGGDASQFLP